MFQEAGGRGKREGVALLLFIFMRPNHSDQSGAFDYRKATYSSTLYDGDVEQHHQHKQSVEQLHGSAEVAYVYSVSCWIISGSSNNKVNQEQIQIATEGDYDVINLGDALQQNALTTLSMTCENQPPTFWRLRPREGNRASVGFYILTRQAKWLNLLV